MELLRLVLIRSFPAVAWSWVGIAIACLLLGAYDWLRHRWHRHQNQNEGVSMNSMSTAPEGADRPSDDPYATIRPRICNGDEPTTILPTMETIRRQDMERYEAFCAGLEAHGQQYTPEQRIALYRVAIRAGRQAEPAGGQL
ncbi:MAG: hypothetical protein H0W02_00190 [Ktedonobacteraceae bacterium]|nr:hypothetical protein [Ktedonobacteraceae bacterium]